MKTYKINGKEISKLLTTVDMTQGDRSIRYCINDILQALGTSVEEPKKELTIEERKEELEKGWEEQENWEFLCSTEGLDTRMDEWDKYSTKQQYIAKLNTAIDKLNKEQGWVEDWKDENQSKNFFYYVPALSMVRTDYMFFMRQYLFVLNYMSEKTADFILKNYQNELKELFNVK